MITYLLFRKMKNQKQPERKKRRDIMKERDGRGISPADKKFPLLFSSISIYNAIQNVM